VKSGTEDNLSAPSSFIANAHKETCAFYMEKSSFLEKKYEPIGGAAAPTGPLESATANEFLIQKENICISVDFTCMSVFTLFESIGLWPVMQQVANVGRITVTTDVMRAGCRFITIKHYTER